jgi:hypothetical protein
MRVRLPDCALLTRSTRHAACRVRERITTAVRLRLEMLQPLISTWPQALGLQVLAAAFRLMGCNTLTRPPHPSRHTL